MFYKCLLNYTNPVSHLYITILNTQISGHAYTVVNAHVTSHKSWKTIYHKARGNSKHFATPPPPVFLQSDVWAMTAEIPHYLVLSNASDWSCCERNLLQPIRSDTQIWVVNVISMESSQLLLTCHFEGIPVVGLWKVSRFLGLNRQQISY